MTIESIDQIPLDHFSGGSNITGDTATDLRGILNAMKAGNPRALIGVDSPGQSSNLGFLDHIEWDQSRITGSLISLSSGAGQAQGIVTLAPAHTYRITVAVGLDLSGDNTVVTPNVFDRTASDILVTDGGVVDPRLAIIGPTATSLEVGLQIITFEFTPTVATDFEIQFSSISSGTITLVRPNSWMTIDTMS
jgi:hypothetical protein